MKSRIFCSILESTGSFGHRVWAIVHQEGAVDAEAESPLQCKLIPLCYISEARLWE